MAGTVTIRLNDMEEAIIEKAAVFYGTGKSSLVKQLAFEKLEDEYDIKIYEDYLKEKESGMLRTRPVDDLWKELGL